MIARRAVLEVVTAVLLGLVSIATAVSAYQGSLLAGEAAALSSTAQRLRDVALTETLSIQLQLREDGKRVFAAVALQSEVAVDPSRADEIAEEQALLAAAGSDDLKAFWEPWRLAGFSTERVPVADPDYLVSLFAEPQSAQYAATAAAAMADRVAARAGVLTGAAVQFAVALFVLGVAGILRAVRPVIALVVGGAALLVGGIVITLVALLGR